DRSAGRDLVRVDPAQLQQALVNLVLRACEEMGDAGRVTVRAVPSASTGMLALQCVDGAPPMSGDVAAHLMDPVGREGAAMTRAALGLAAVGRFAESSGGRVWATPIDQGNMVVLELPLQPGAVSANRPAVVLCEDHPLLRPMLTEAITAAGHRVLPVERATDMLATLRAEGKGGVAVMDDAAWAIVGPGWEAWVAELGWRPGAVLLLEREVADLPAAVATLRKPCALEALLGAITMQSTVQAPTP
ncbi:MAG: ATP-binding protein, partial [Planctomycetota bacterium]